MQTRATPTLALLSACLLAGSSAHAATASASIGSVQIQVIDLDPTDGITAGISFGDALTLLYSEAWFNNVGVGYVDQIVETPGAALGPLQNNGSGYSVTMQSWAGGLLSAPGWSATGSTSVSGPGYSTESGAHQFVRFTLTANTQVIITLDKPMVQVAALPGESSGGSVYLDVHANDESVSDWANVSVFSALPNNPAIPGQLQVSLSNAGLTPMNAYLDSEVTIFANGVAAPIPEPQAGGLLAAGLAALGMLRRRRKTV